VAEPLPTDLPAHGREGEERAVTVTPAQLGYLLEGRKALTGDCRSTLGVRKRRADCGIVNYCAIAGSQGTRVVIEWIPLIYAKCKYIIPTRPWASHLSSPNYPKAAIGNSISPSNKLSVARAAAGLMRPASHR